MIGLAKKIQHSSHPSLRIGLRLKSNLRGLLVKLNNNKKQAGKIIIRMKEVEAEVVQVRKWLIITIKRFNLFRHILLVRLHKILNKDHIRQWIKLKNNNLKILDQAVSDHVLIPASQAKPLAIKTNLQQIQPSR